MLRLSIAIVISYTKSSSQSHSLLYHLNASGYTVVVVEKVVVIVIQFDNIIIDEKVRTTPADSLHQIRVDCC
jgi:hypothetical protein